MSWVSRDHCSWDETRLWILKIHTYNYIYTCYQPIKLSIYINNNIWTYNFMDYSSLLASDRKMVVLTWQLVTRQTSACGMMNNTHIVNLTWVVTSIVWVMRCSASLKHKLRTPTCCLFLIHYPPFQFSDKPYITVISACMHAARWIPIGLEAPTCSSPTELANTGWMAVTK